MTSLTPQLELLKPTHDKLCDSRFRNLKCDCNLAERQAAYAAVQAKLAESHPASTVEAQAATIATLRRELEQAKQYEPKIGHDYRLSPADLDRIINECGAGNDLSDCVKDLLLAHYELEELHKICDSLQRQVEQRDDQIKYERHKLEQQTEDLERERHNRRIAEDAYKKCHVKHLALERQVEQLKTALTNLVDALERCHADKRYESVWTLYAVHGGRYDGPFYKDELAAAKALLKPVEQEERQG